MAYLGIDQTPCPKCGSRGTVEEGECLHPGVVSHDPENPRRVILHCLQCGHRESYGIYKILGNTLIKA